MFKRFPIIKWWLIWIVMIHVLFAIGLVIFKSFGEGAGLIYALVALVIGASSLIFICVLSDEINKVSEKTNKTTTTPPQGDWR